MLANTVPAVQALGQCVFLPMLIIGGVAVPLASLPSWAQRLASYFPGRYAVDAIQSAVNGGGLGAGRFSVLALLLIGTAGCLAGGRLFRWDAEHRIAPADYGWVAVALAAWIAVGVVAERRNFGVQPEARLKPRPPSAPEQPRLSPQEEQALTRPPDAEKPRATGAATPVPERPEPRTPSPEPQTPSPERPEPRAPESRTPNPEPRAPSREPRTPSPEPRTSSPEPRTPSPEPRTPSPGPPATWREVTMAIIDRDLRFDRLPPDEGVVCPIAPVDEQPDTDLANHLDFIATTLLSWKPAHVADPVQRVRNVLFVAAVPDVFQMEPLERFIPLVVFDHLRQNMPPGDLPKILYWIALHPSQGDDAAVDELQAFKLGNGPSDIDQARERVALYAVKLLGRITGKIQ
jgi:hypothetical protein